MGIFFGIVGLPGGGGNGGVDLEITCKFIFQCFLECYLSLIQVIYLGFRAGLFPRDGIVGSVEDSVREGRRGK